MKILTWFIRTIKKVRIKNNYRENFSIRQSSCKIKKFIIKVLELKKMN
jgi:hypothetical protein